MLDDQSSYFGFDAAADEVSVVHMRRDADGRWMLTHTDGPPNPDLSHVVARIIDNQPPRPQPLVDRPLGELVDQWLEAHQGIKFELTDEQQADVLAAFERLLAEGKIRLRV